MSFQPWAFVENLSYMGEGMLCILVVMGVLIGITALLNRVTKSRK